jgi:hypothetical protein
MQAPEPFRIAIEREGVTRCFELRYAAVKQRGDRKVSVPYFIPVGEPGVDSPFKIIENYRNGLTFDGQVAVARALIRLQGFTPDEAANVAGRLKARIEGLTLTEGTVLIEQIRAALDT